MEFIKKNYLYIGITIFFIILMILLFFIFKNSKITYHTLTASDGSFQISFPSNISVTHNNDNEFVIDLYATKEDMFFYANTIEKSRMIDLPQIINKDKENDFKLKQNIREDSGLLSLNFDSYTGYEYHYIYTDNSYGKDFYSHVVWIETDKNLYVLNFEIPQENVEKFQDIFNNIKNSFVEL